MNEKIIIGDVRDVLPTLESESVQMCVTSPPYWGLRDYGVDGQLGLEKTPEEYVARMVAVFREVRRVLKGDGTLWLNLGDSYNGSQQTGGTNSISGKGGSQPHGGLAKNVHGLKPKDLIGIPWRVAFALQADGWYLRQDIIWHKPNPMPESVTDRCTKAHEYLFLFSKAPRYYFDAEAIAEKSDEASGWAKQRAKGINTWAYNDTPERINATGQHTDGSTFGANGRRNRRSVWTVASQAYPEAHFATFPEKLIEPCILAGSRPVDVVLDPFLGSGTTGQVCERLGRQWVGIELNPDYAGMAERRTAQMGLCL